MTSDQLIRLTQSSGKENTLKLSRRDLAYACGMRLTGKKFSGGTTIAGTMLLAHLAGIKVFATGGLGGVHRGAESSMDISADLTELGRTPVAVISSGCKSFLDVPRTLEYLETQGVGVATFADGREGKVDFPGFWSRDSGVISPLTISDEKAAAAIIHAQFSFPIHSGLLLANPIPEAVSIPKAEMDSVIKKAIKEAYDAGATGKDNTPFVLAKIKELTGGKSIPANRALIENNVKRGTMVAKELRRLEFAEAIEGGPHVDRVYPAMTVASQANTSAGPQTSDAVPSVSPGNENIPEMQSPVDILVAGALAIDFSCDFTPLPGRPSTSPILHTSNPARITQTLGGVGHNVAKALNLLGSSVRLCSAVGDDLSGKAALAQLRTEGLDTSSIQTLPSSGSRTAQYIAINTTTKDLHLGMADMSILETPHTDFDSTYLPLLAQANPTHLVLDANWDPVTLHAWLRAARTLRIPVAFEPVSAAKSTRLFSPPPANSQSAFPTFPNNLVNLITPNTHELHALHAHAQQSGLLSQTPWWNLINSLNIPSTGARAAFSAIAGAELVDKGVPQMSVQLLPFCPTVLVKLGAEGVLLTMLLPSSSALLRDPEAQRWVVSRNDGGGGEQGVGGVYMRLFPVPETIAQEDVVSVNGVGDTFLGAVVAGLVAGREVEDVLGVAQRAAGLTLRSAEAVSPRLRELRGEI
ncbi:IdgA domain protein [Patellaria atrata CBS 101060]|uniref:IdgA domain protein n=1 Tax=Patellaria atrata CBS 101060 TaxID=1346257 RepID=A0A9P4VM62_9PEZI|nr:IdgA domain protein [Patellaria atrata CBS 101060]